MRKVIVIAALLGAAGAGLTAVVLAQAPRVWVDEGERSGVVTEFQPGQSVEAPVIRRLAMLGGRGVEIGVSIRDLDPDQAAGTNGGALVESVREKGPADKAGVRKGDVLVEFDGERVRSARQLSRLVSETAEGRTVQAVAMRDGTRVELTLSPEVPKSADRAFSFAVPGGEFAFPGEMRELERLPDLRFKGELPRWREEGRVEPFEFFLAPGRGRLGIGIQSLTPQLSEYFGSGDGVLVTSVEADSPAAKAGLKAGDVITKVNGEAVTSPGELTRRVHQADEDAELTIDYTRDRKSATTKATLEPRERPKRGQTVQPI